jgi:hypothetical protein
MTTKELMKFIDTLRPGRTITEGDAPFVEALGQHLEGRLSAGRKRVHESDKARYAYHNAKRRALKKRMAQASSAIDIADKVI